MTTRKFSAISLPHPKYSFEIGYFDLRTREEINLATWLPRFSDLAQVIEVRRTGCLSSLTDGCFDSSKIINPYIVIDNARPELFLRRDFIKKFVELGTIYLVQLDDFSNPCSNRVQSTAHTELMSGYELFTSDKNVLSIILDEKQYRRFGMIGRKLKNIRGARSNCSKRYRIDIDLNEEKIKTSNKYQDRLIMILRRLNPINKLYFRFASGEKFKLTSSEANNYSLEFLKYVIDEYAMDGFEPVPLTGCSSVCQKVQRNWTNYSQLHPNLIDKLVDKLAQDKPVKEENIQRDMEILDGVVKIVDWLGYQLLSLDCDREEIQSKCLAAAAAASLSDDDDVRRRLDVSCVEISGLLDVQQIQENLGKIFDCSSNGSKKAQGAPVTAGTAHCDEHPQSTVFRALNLYRRGQQDAGVILIQDCSTKERSHLIKVVGLSSSSSWWSSGAW